MGKLTTKQKKFIKEAVETGNGTLAAKKAYSIGSKGGSKTPEQVESTAASIASENLRKPNVISAMDQLLEKLNFTKDDRIIILAEIAKKKEDSRNRIGAIKETNRMTGAYPQDQLNIEDGSVSIVIRKP